MLSSLLNFEARYQLKRKAFIGFSLIFLGFGYILGSQGFAPANVYFNSAYQISYNMALTSLGCVFAIMFFTVSGILRDKQYNMEAILYTTSVQKSYFFLSRFTGVFLASLITFTMALVGFFLGNLSPRLDPDRIMSFELTYYLWSWLIIIIPNKFICTSIIFSVSVLTKNNMATYISAIFLYAAYFICSIFFNSPLMANTVPGESGDMLIAALADPFGLSAFFEQTQFWTPMQKNTELIHFSGYFMWNRLLWIFFSLLLLSVTYKLFSFKKMNVKAKKEPEIISDLTQIKPYIAVENINLNTRYQVLSFLSLLKMELKSVFKSLPFIAIVLVWLIILISEIHIRINESGSYSDSLYPTTNLLISLIKEPLPILSLLLIVFYSGELIWKERMVHFNGIIDTTPTSNIAFFMSKGITLMFLPIILISISIMVALGFQIGGCYSRFEIWQYLSMFYFFGMGLLFNVMLALFIQNIVPNKYLGMVITGLIIIVFQSPLASKLGLEHTLLRIGKFPSLEYANMTGYGDYAVRFHHYAILWTSFGIILSHLAFKLWQRGAIRNFGSSIAACLSQWTSYSRMLIFLYLVVFLFSGSIIFYNTNIETEYVTVEDNLDFREGYERMYKKFDSLESLVLVDIYTKVDLYPDEGKYSIIVNCILENTTNTPIDTMLIFERLPLSSVLLEKAKLIQYDSIYSTYMYVYDQSIQPKEQVRFSYTLVHEKKGFDIDNSIVNNGSYITSQSFEPAFGYRHGIEITDAFERKQRNLPKRKDIELDSHLHEHSQNDRKVNFETIISTASDQTAIAPGDLIKKWNAANRNYFQYKTTNSIIPTIAYFSAKYTMIKEDYKGISIEQYFNDTDTFNIKSIQNSTKIALDYCIKNFGAYPFQHLRIAEIPGHWPFGGFAHPGTISMVEDRLYLIDQRDENNFDLVAKRTIHEVSHQWFGHVLTPKNVEGASIFTEGFAKYTEAAVMEKLYGIAAIRQLSATANRTYYSGRSNDSEKEPPLSQVKGQSYLSYGKSYTIMLALRELIGEDTLNSVIKKMINRHKNDIGFTATSTEFIKELYLVTPVENHPLLHDWFHRVISYDVSIKNAEVKKLDVGYEIKINLAANRYETQANGNETPISIHEPIQIGLFSRHPDKVKSSEDIIYLKSSVINANEQTIKLIVNQMPEYVVVDPLGTRSDKNLVDNIFHLK